MRVKMIFLSVLLTLMVFIVFACQYNSTYEDDSVRVIKAGYSESKEGILYACNLNRGALSFYDFESMKSVYMCGKPNCSHMDTEVCGAFRERQLPFIFDSMLYYFEFQMSRDKDDKIVAKTKLVQSDISGSSEKTIGEVDGEIYPVTCYLIHKNLYFFVDNYIYDDSTNTNYSSKYLWSFDFNTGGLKRLCLIKEGYNLGMFLYGYADEKLFMDLRYTENDLDFMTTDINDFKKATIEKNCFVDVISGEINEIELPPPLLVEAESYFYNQESNNGAYKFVRRDWKSGKETIVYDGLAYDMLKFVDNKLFFRPSEGYGDNGRLIFNKDLGQYCYDIKTEKLIKVDCKNPDNIYLDILTAYRDNYIVYLSDFDNEIYNRLSYISKNDYFNGMERYIMLDLPF